MFNRIDYSSTDWTECCKLAEAVAPHPRDYYLGLPEPALTLPKNVILFKRHGFDQKRGTEEHHRFLMIFCLKEKGSVIVDGRVAPLRPGCALLVTPHQFHHYARVTGTKLLWLFLSFELDDIEALNFLRGRVLELTPMQVSYLRQLAGLYAVLAGEQKASSEITLLAALILAEFRRINSLGKVTKPATEEVTPDRRLIQDVARFAHRHSTETIHIPDVAKAVGISESYLRARFHALAGIGLGTYIRRLQLHRARAMMFASELRLSEIAERCGYDSIYTFSRTFRREMGMSPSHYRLQGNRNRSQR